MAKGRLCVVIATPPGFNSGMVAVELALLSFAHRHSLADRMDVVRPFATEQRLVSIAPEPRALELRRMRTDLRTTVLPSLDALHGYERLLFWGDFQHMAQYLRALSGQLAPLNPALAESCGGRIENLLLLDDSPHELLDRTLSFGTTLLFNCLADALDADYQAKLERFARRTSRIWVRDVLSAAQLARATGDYTTNYWGPDCAQLLTTDLLRDHLPQAESGGCYVFFGRSENPAPPYLELAARLAAARGVGLTWLPWGTPAAFPHLGRALPHRPPLPSLSEDTAAVEMIARLSRAALVVTDTYHLCVLAWTFGVPAVCICDASSSDPASVNSGRRFCWRDKREIFFSQYDALDFFVHGKELRDGELFEARLEHVDRMLAAPGAVQRVHDNVVRHGRSIAALLASRLLT